MRNKMTICVFTLALVAGATAAQAQSDQKVYPGSMCVDFKHTDDTAYSYSTVGNSATSAALKLDCVAVNDSTAGASIGSAWLKAKDCHGTQAVECNLNSIFPGSSGGLSGWISPALATAGSSCNWQTLTFGSLASNASAHYYFSCSVPAVYSGKSSWIGNYSVTE